MEQHRVTPLEKEDFAAVCAAAEEYGLRPAEACRLPGYEDSNFLVTGEGGDAIVLKVTSNAKAAALIEAECALLEHVADVRPNVPTPRFLRTTSGNIYTSLRGDGRDLPARAHSFLRGTLLMHFRPRSPSLRRDVGRRLGELADALAGFDHAAYHRDFEWDVVNALQLRGLSDLIADSDRRRSVTSLLDTFDSHVVPNLTDLRKSIIHADANDHNLLIDTTETGQPFLSGIVDFGDAVLTVTVAEVAIACAYAMLAEKDPVAAASDLVSGFHSAFPLKPLEIEVLYPLILARLAMSALLSARWRATNGDSVYHTVSEKDVWSLIQDLRDVDLSFAHHAFRDACGLPASPNTSTVTGYLRNAAAEIGSLLPPPITMQDGLVLDFSVSSPDAAGPDDVTDTAAWTAFIFERMAHAKASVGIGRYDEPRVCYGADQFLTSAGEQRTIHLGIDLFTPTGTPVLVPIHGTVHSFRDNDLTLDYGPTVILEHRIESPGDEPAAISFCTLYGHLSRESLQQLEVGRRVERGERIGSVGSVDENGGWPPHVHFQLVVDMYGQHGNFPGVAPASRRSLWKAVCPDPNLILGIPERLFPPDPMTRDEISSARTAFVGPNLSLAYRKPLHIVRGLKQHLFDADGRQYLDCVNNVAHVGHCHPRVVDAVSRQMRVLNTNTRYLHENIVRYAARVADTMPSPLQVCYFVNSGSEANDLALRMAKAYTDGRDVLVLGSAYHGNLSSTIDISPYKAEGKGGRGLPSHVHRVSAPDIFRGPYRNADTAAKDYANEVSRTLTGLAAGGRRLCAMIVESALSCAGQVMLPPGYLREVYSLVRSAGGVCIADEVQVGFGRIGTHFWAFDAQGAVPDIVTLGKPMGNGHPIGAVITTADIAASFDNGMEYFNTYGGNPVSCAAGLAVLDVLRDEQLQAQALAVGSRLMRCLHELKQRHRIIGDVRGSGLFLGIELVRGDDGEPARAEADYVVNRLKEEGILLSTDGPHRNVLKFKPPMVFSPGDADRLTETLDIVLRDNYLRSASR